MSDTAAEHFEQQSPKENGNPTGGRSITLSITAHPNGQIDFSMPTNKILAWGLLGAAQEQLAKMAVASDLAQAQAARGGMNGLLKKLGRN